MKLIFPLLTLVLIFTSCGSQQAPSPRFDHVFVQVSNIEQSVNFYTSAFDLQVTNRLEDFVITNPDGEQTKTSRKIALLKFPGQDFVFELGETSKIDSQANFAIYDHVGIDVKEIDKAIKQAVNAGAELATPVHLIQSKGIELKFANLKGPDGEVIELHQIISGVY